MDTTTLKWLITFILLISLIILLSLCKLEKFTLEYFGSSCVDFIPFRRTQYYPKRDGIIFVSVASYRDDECSQTITSIYREASQPNRIYVGVCQQNKDPREDCLSRIASQYRDQIKIIDMSYKEAKGPTFARYWCSTLWEGEEYFLQIDSHTQFQPNWDDNLVHMLEKCDSKRPILSVYPPTQKQLTTKGVPIMCNGKLNDGIPVFLAGWTHEISEPQKSPKPFAAGGFMFLRGDFLYDVPYDPNLSHLFQGEECLLSARLWTYGWDFYTPNIKVCSHTYTRKGKPKFWEDHPEHGECRKNTETRILALLGRPHRGETPQEDLLARHHQYGLGGFRSLTDFWKCAGINWDEETIEDWCSKGVSNYFKGWNFNLSGWEKIKKWN